MAALACSGWDHDSLQEMVGRTVFNLLAGNGEAHLENWSLVYPDLRAARLAPAHDLVCTAVFTRSTDLGLSVPVELTLESVTRESFPRFQTLVRVGDDDVVVVVDEVVERFHGVWAGVLTPRMPRKLGSRPRPEPRLPPGSIPGLRAATWACVRRPGARRRGQVHTQRA